MATWAASRAVARTQVRNFSVKKGKKILESMGMRKLIDKPDGLPKPKEFDDWHKKKCERAMAIAKKNHIRHFSYGIAAKLINAYLKVVFICGGYHKCRKVKVIHPPIDRILLKELRKKKNKNQKAPWMKGSLAWSKFDGNKYRKVIQHIRAITNNNDGLWKIEEYWRGYQ